MRDWGCANMIEDDLEAHEDSRQLHVRKKLRGVNMMEVGEGGSCIICVTRMKYIMVDSRGVICASQLVEMRIVK